jgi:hypothetical protein
MKKLFIVFIGLFIVQLSFAQNEVEVKSKVTSATVFLNGAQVTRQAKQVNIPKGRSKLKFVGLTNKVNKSSLTVSSDGDFTIVSVMHQLNYLEEKETTQEISDLDVRADDLNEKIVIASQMLSVYSSEESLLATNKNLKGSQTGLKISELQAAADFYRSRLTEINLKKHTLNKEIQAHKEDLVKIANQLRELNAKQNRSTSEVIVEVNSKRNLKTAFDIIYLVSSAGWFPNYDIRVKNVSSPVALTYKANVFQLTGEDWSNIKLTLSTGNPYERSTKPVLQPWRLYFYNTPTAYRNQGYRNQQSAVPSTGSGYSGVVRGYIRDEYGEALIGASVYVVGTSYGSTTNIDGYYQINVPAGSNAQSLQVSYLGYSTATVAINNSVVNANLYESDVTMDEVVVSGYSEKKKSKDKFSKSIRRRNVDKSLSGKAYGVSTQPLAVQRTQKATTTEFEIDLPYSIPNNGKQYAVDIKEDELKADYEYYAAPKLDLSAYLTARIPDWEDYNLISGEVNLYFEGTYLGKTVLDVNNVNDTLDISLGKDKNIVIERTKLKEYNRKKLIGSQQIATRGWTIDVRNKKKESINLVIQDQIPLSTTKDIEVELKEKSKADLNATTAILTWKLDLKTNSKKELIFKYEVKYPKNQRLQLE